MKHALIITTIGGFVPQFEMNDVRLLQECGYTVHYASNFQNPVYSIDKEELERQGLVLHHIDIRKSPFRFWHSIKAFIQLRKLIKDEQVQLVHCHNPNGGVVGRLAAAFTGNKPYIMYTAHGFHFYDGAPKINWLFFYPVERILAACTNRLITINREDYERAKKFRLGKCGHVEHIPGVGVNLIKFQQNQSQRKEKRKELGIPNRAFHIVSVGEINENKNHEIMIRAIANLKDSDIYYSICGKGNNEKHLRDLIWELHLEKRIRLLGYRTDVNEVLQSADCFAFPSKREGFGIAAVEAMACAVPVIAADNRGTREYMQHGVNGIVCRANVLEDFEKAIKKLKDSPDVRKELAMACRRTAERFGLVATDKIMRRVYREISEEQERM